MNNLVGQMKGITKWLHMNERGSVAFLVKNKMSAVERGSLEEVAVFCGLLLELYCKDHDILSKFMLSVLVQLQAEVVAST